MHRSSKKILIRLVWIVLLVVALVCTIHLLLRWEKGREVQSLQQAAIAAEFAHLSPGEMEEMRANPPGGRYIVRTTGSCAGAITFTPTKDPKSSKDSILVSGTVAITGIVPASPLLVTLPSQPLPSTTWSEENPMADKTERLTSSGSVSIMGVTSPELFAARIPSQRLVHELRDDGWQVARITGVFYWFDSSGRRASPGDLPAELQAAAEDCEVQERLASTLMKRLDAMPWNATNVERLRAGLLEKLKDDIAKLRTLRARFDWQALKSGLPGYPSFVTREANLAWQWGSSPTIQPPSSAPSMVKVELEPTK